MRMNSRWALVVSIAWGATNALASASASGGSVQDYYHSEGYIKQAKAYYLQQAENTANSWASRRAKIIAQAQADCQERYQGVHTELVLLQSEFLENNAAQVSSGEVYTVGSKDNWLVVETIRCSYEGGFDVTVLNSVLLQGSDNATLTFAKDSGRPAISEVHRNFKLGKSQLKGWAKRPYAAQN